MKNSLIGIFHYYVDVDTCFSNISMLTTMAREFCEKLPKIELHAHLNGSLSVPTINELYNLHKLSFPNEEIPNVSDITIGQVHDMFSRIYRIRMYKYFSTKDYVIFLLISSSA